MLWTPPLRIHKSAKCSHILSLANGLSGKKHVCWPCILKRISEYKRKRPSRFYSPTAPFTEIDDVIGIRWIQTLIFMAVWTWFSRNTSPCWAANSSSSMACISCKSYNIATPNYKYVMNIHALQHGQRTSHECKLVRVGHVLVRVFSGQSKYNVKCFIQLKCDKLHTTGPEKQIYSLYI